MWALILWNNKRMFDIKNGKNSSCATSGLGIIFGLNGTINTNEHTFPHVGPVHGSVQHGHTVICSKWAWSVTCMVEKKNS